MNYQSVFHLLSDISKQAGIPLILIGGFAVNYYKYTRQSADVDFLIQESDFQKMSELLKSTGYKLDYSQEVFARFISTGDSIIMDIDFMLIDEETFDKIIKDSQKADIAGCEFRVPSLEHLIALKLHAVKYNPKPRLIKDIPDIINLIKINKVDVKSGKFKELCLKYGTQELYEKILESS
ncbi:MAG: nucleotidyl transferase AbiEii/AbiGii toxin family protein [Candidatus Omnitrophota bacterium]|nr:nucleotidyl transferase AbiEii/AbiGii toxin family protein [Candidatus Omnitrophota bacterium]